MTDRDRLRQEYEAWRAEAIDVHQEIAASRFTSEGELRKAFREATRASENLIAAADAFFDTGSH